jgi:hypothetical protein
MTNREKLEDAGVIRPGHNFNPQDNQAIENLSNEEVDVLINVYNELGEEFLERNCPHGIVF